MGKTVANKNNHQRVTKRNNRYKCDNCDNRYKPDWLGYNWPMLAFRDSYNTSMVI